MTNKFDSTFERVERAFRKQETLTPDEQTKRESLAQAMENFDNQKKSKNFQGKGSEARLSQSKRGLANLFDWRHKMKTINSKQAYSLMGGASIAVIALVAVAPGLMDNANLPNILPKPQSTAESLDDGSGANVSEPLAPIEAESDAAVSKPAPNVQLNELATSPSAKVATRSKPMLQSNQLAGDRAPSKSYSRIAPPSDVVVPQYPEQSGDKFEKVAQNEVKLVGEAPVSTFSVDVDTASYSFMRSSLNNNVLPNPDSIRIEELINYFDYDYAGPSDISQPFKANVQIMPTPWNEGTKLLSIGIKGYELAAQEQPNSNLVFLIDTSGSMNQANKLPLLISSFKLLLDKLKPSDRLSIVTYAGSAGTALEPTKASERDKILSALDRLSAAGSTAGAAGIRQAYALAEQNLDSQGVNRVILATDGDFNVGISDPEQLKTYISKKRESGVELSVLGFGRGNYNDVLMQSLAQNGNGNAAYIDTLSEARKVLVEEAGSTLFTIAKDVKLQIEFNPALVSEYRLIGYETRALKREDFNNDKVDAGEIGAGHKVTALYEITPVGASSKSVDPLRYSSEENQEATPAASANSDEYGFLKIRYKLPDSNVSTLITRAIDASDEVRTIKQASDNSRFAASVAAFGQLLKGGKYTADYSYDDVISLAQSAKGDDEFGYRSQFINLVRSAESIERLR